MSSRKQRNANYRNSLLSTGPKPESLEHTRFNGVTHGARARTTVLPREDLAAYNRMVEDWNGDCRPRTPAERALVLEIANAQWKLQRVESAQDERVAAGIGDAGTREDVAVFKKMERLFWDPRGPISSYGLRPLAQGGPPTSWSGQVDDPNQPYLLVKELEASAKGCQAFSTNGQFYGAGLRITSPGSRPTDSRPYACSGNNLLTWPSIGESLRFTSPPSRCTRWAKRMRTTTSSATW